jgi:DNA-nicking Smr family endonuclease
MSRKVSADERRLWGHVAATVRPLAHEQTPGLALPPPKPDATLAKPGTPKGPLEGIEPGRKRRIARDPAALEARLDLHGLDQAKARAELADFVNRAWSEGERSVLVITGRGVMGDGVLRKRAPEWLGEPGLREVVAGVSEAHQKHGGDGALYVALKRRPKR